LINLPTLLNNCLYCVMSANSFGWTYWMCTLQIWHAVDHVSSCVY